MQARNSPCWRNEKAIVSAALVLALISCLEEANLQNVLRVLDGSLELDCSGPNGGMCTMTGEGEMSIQGHRCQMNLRELSCDGVPLDLSLGGVLIRRNGEIAPVNPLPTLAR